MQVVFADWCRSTPWLQRPRAPILFSTHPCRSQDTSGAASGGAQPGLLEVRGCGWGTRQAAEANEAQDAMAALLSKGGGGWGRG